MNVSSTISVQSLVGVFSDPRCRNIVCSFHDSCCSSEWEDTCDEIAENLCKPDVEEIPSIGGDCPFGMTCSYEQMANCTELVTHYNDTMYLGNVLGGIYCGGGEADFYGIQNCPRGSYCPDPETKLPCPAGYFCPYKTLDPTLPCARCKEGALELERDLYGWIGLLIILVLAVAYIAWGLLNRYNKRVADHVSDLEQRALNRIENLKSDMTGNDSEQSRELEQLRPKLELIKIRLANMERTDESARDVKVLGSSKKIIDGSKAVELDGERIRFDAIRLFDVLDIDGSGDLSFDELNAILGLSEVELKEFIRRMNEMAADSSSDKNTVTRPVFAKYFLQVLTDTNHIAISYEEAEAIFDSFVDGNKSTNEINMNKFYSSSMSEFLSDSQILQLIKAFKALKTDVDILVQDPHHDDLQTGSEQLSRTINRRGSLSALRASRRPSTMALEAIITAEEATDQKITSSLRGATPTTKTSGGKSTMMIGRKLFIEKYPQLLMDIMLKEEDGDDHTELIDICGVDLCFKDLSLSIKVGKQTVDVVNNVTGRIRGKTMTALMGGSGAGKTSLLNALCGRAHYGETTGTVYLNGHETDIESHVDCIGFVPQDDIVYAELTVRENFIFAGKFRLPKGTSDKEVQELVDETIANLGLARVANSPVGDVKRRGVSGGEKKRVNIGLELMGMPSILFLDEPTSGLDASSALLVMKSLNHLVERDGVTVVSVIHQPRKFIYDLFDSLILLGVGGEIMYHGPTEGAEPYFDRLNYKLPKGESVSDWLIDISSGRLEPENNISLTKGESKKKGKDSKVGGKEHILPQPGVINDDNCVGKKGVTTGKVVRALEDAKLRRTWLCEEWLKYFDNMGDKEKTLYEPPEKYDLPIDIEKPSFSFQFVNQVKRALLVAWRDRLTRIITATIIVGSVIFITALDGVTSVSIDLNPDLPFDVLVRPQERDQENIFNALFAYVHRQQIQYPMKVGIVLCIIVGLTATTNLTSKRMEFFRESGSGYDINAYFFAINIISTIEFSIQVLIAALFATWIRNPIASYISYYIHFLLLTWVTVSWSMFFPMVCSPDTVPLVAGFFFTFCGLVFSGAFSPFGYEAIYEEGGFKEVLVGWVSPTRFFFEALTVGEYRCLPEQSGFTIASSSSNRNSTNTMMRKMGYAGRDLQAVRWSCDGWYWSVAPAILIGITVRYLAFGAMHACFRAQQAKKPLIHKLQKKRTCFPEIFYVAGFILLVSFTTVVFIVDQPFDENVPRTELQLLNDFGFFD
ncbi:unnamed protein product [Pseudo-nitzschia multistriata]|uniref:Uncharacterized protein n=1 Tax=Pseudo-nitzschia multistriata TaxID=183589 RepID=A0A448Z870_9STRA|nr:unnamed protein product [Pseudo-nitzschia multistriata]